MRVTTFDNIPWDKIGIVGLLIAFVVLIVCTVRFGLCKKFWRQVSNKDVATKDDSKDEGKGKLEKKSQAKGKGRKKRH